LPGELRQLLPRRPDLKIIVTSTTIDAQRFADHFAARKRLRDGGGVLRQRLRFAVATRATRPFEAARVNVVNPWQASP